MQQIALILATINRLNCQLSLIYAASMFKILSLSDYDVTIYSATMFIILSLSDYDITIYSATGYRVKEK